MKYDSYQSQTWMDGGTGQDIGRQHDVATAFQDLKITAFDSLSWYSSVSGYRAKGCFS